jgi:hypothetical protein
VADPGATAKLARVADDNGLRQFLDAEQRDAVRFLTNANDAVAMYRSQGRAQFIEAMIKQLDAAKKG